MTDQSTSMTPVLRGGVLILTAVVFVFLAITALKPGGGMSDLTQTRTGSDFDLANMSAAESDAFGEAVRAYLMENPEVIMEAVAVLEERQQEAAARADEGLIQDLAEQIFDDGYSHVSGNPDGDVTIVEFIDYRCGYCRRAHGEVAELIASDGNIRLITKEFPILGPNSQASSEFAIAVKQLAGGEAYEMANEVLIGFNAEMNEAAIRRLSETIGVDADAVLGAMKSGPVQQEIIQTRALAQRMNINGTPTFVVGDELLRGYLPLDGMRQVVAGVREAG